MKMYSYKVQSNDHTTELVSKNNFFSHPDAVAAGHKFAATLQEEVGGDWWVQVTTTKADVELEQKTTPATVTKSETVPEITLHDACEHFKHTHPAVWERFKFFYNNNTRTGFCYDSMAQLYCTAQAVKHPKDAVDHTIGKTLCILRIIYGDTCNYKRILGVT